MIPVSRETFESLVREALESLPEALQAEISNLEIIVRDRPTRDEWHRSGRNHTHVHERSGVLFGLYRGIPLTARNTSYDKVLPDLITIYQEAHEQACDTEAELAEEVARTVRHEIAHHFGIDDDRLRELGQY